MGQMQPKDNGEKPSQDGRINATGNVRWSPSELKDRVGAKFQGNSPMVNNPATGNGKQGNPGKPT